MKDPACQAWCRENTTKCDSAVIAYCDLNPDDAYCACLKSPANTKGIINPRCVDRKCLTTGYMTTGMLQTQCPSMVDCSIQATLNNSGVILSNQIPIQQNCGTPTTPTTPNTSNPPQVIITEPAQSSSSLLIFFIFLFIIFVISLGVIIFVLVSSNDTS